MNKGKNTNMEQVKTEEELVDERLKKQRRSNKVKWIITISILLAALAVVVFFFIYTDPENVRKRQYKMLSKKAIDFYNNLFFEHDYDKYYESIAPERRDGSHYKNAFEYMMNNYENLDYSDITYEVTDYRIDNDKNIKLYIEYQLNISNLDPDIDFPRVMPITLVKENKKWYVFDFARVAYYEGTDGYIHVFETYY